MTYVVTITQLIDWLEGRLTEEQGQAVAAAVQADEALQAAAGWLRSFLVLSAGTILVDPSPELTYQVQAEFRRYARTVAQPGWLQTLNATLAFDSWRRPSLAGVRQTGLDAPSRQLVFQADTADIVLNTRASRDNDLFDLTGQVFPLDESDPDSYVVQLLSRGQEVELTSTNSVGRFTCNGLNAGTYTLIVRGDAVEISLHDVELSAGQMS